MTASTSESAFWRGLRNGAPFLVMAVPFAALFGVVAADAGLQLAQTVGFSLLVIAGAAQFTALQLMLDNTSIALVLIAALAVNLRMAMYSASLVPHLGAAPLWQRAGVAYLNFDQSYMLSVMEYDEKPEMTVSEKVAYFFGIAALIAPAWVMSTLAGAVLGAQIPEGYALDFMVPIMFLAMVGPMLKTLAHVAAAFTSAAFGLALAGLPSGSGLLIASVIAMAVGAAVETFVESRR